MVWWISIHSKSINWYVIPQWRDNKERELNVCTNVKTSNRKKLWLKTLVDSEYTHTGIDEQLVKKE